MHSISAMPELSDFERGDIVKLVGPSARLRGQWARVEFVGRSRVHVVVLRTGARACVAPAHAWPESTMLIPERGRVRVKLAALVTVAAVTFAGGYVAHGPTVRTRTVAHVVTVDTLGAAIARRADQLRDACAPRAAHVVATVDAAGAVDVSGTCDTSAVAR